ncbi:hypothetical protein GUY61_05085, partial [Streptomyces sp. GC420]|nr:hypothetical protein [Streptomyces sp. GC420]
MTVLLWVVLTPVVLAVLGIGLYFGTAIVKGAIEGWREGTSGDNALPDEAAALGLLPAERQNTGSAGPLPAALTSAAAAAEKGDWQPAAALLQDIGEDWERRSHASYRLAEAAVKDDDWLLAWENARPEDPGAALVRARSSVSLAWEIRGAKRAKYTTAEQFEGFHRTLARAREDIARAA